MAARAVLAERERTALLLGAEPLSTDHARVRGVRKAHQERHQRAPEPLWPEFRLVHTELAQPRIVLGFELEPRIFAGTIAGDAEFVMRHSGQIRIERARKMWTIVEQTAQGLGRHAHVVSPGEVHAAIHIAFEVTGFAAEATVSTLARIAR